MSCLTMRLAMHEVCSGEWLASVRKDHKGWGWDHARPLRLGTGTPLFASRCGIRTPSMQWVTLYAFAGPTMQSVT